MQIESFDIIQKVASYDLAQSGKLNPFLTFHSAFSSSDIISYVHITLHQHNITLCTPTNLCGEDASPFLKQFATSG